MCVWGGGGGGGACGCGWVGGNYGLRDNSKRDVYFHADSQWVVASFLQLGHTTSLRSSLRKILLWVISIATQSGYILLSTKP